MAEVKNSRGSVMQAKMRLRKKKSKSMVPALKDKYVLNDRTGRFRRTQKTGDIIEESSVRKKNKKRG